MNLRVANPLSYPAPALVAVGGLRIADALACDLEFPVDLSRNQLGLSSGLPPNSNGDLPDLHGMAGF